MWTTRRLDLLRSTGRPVRGLRQTLPILGPKPSDAPPHLREGEDNRLVSEPTKPVDWHAAAFEVIEQEAADQAEWDEMRTLLDRFSRLRQAQLTSHLDALYGKAW